MDEDRFRTAIRRLDADLLGLQEVDRNQPRSGHADLTVIAAEAMGASHHVFVAALVGTPDDSWSAATGDERPGSAAYGIALLSRYPVLGRRTTRLPAAPVVIPHRFPGRLRPDWVRDEPRVALVVDVDTPRGRLDVVTTHLSFVRPWNRVQLRRLLRDLGPRERPTVLMGDLNMGPGPAGRVTGMTPLAAGATFPARSPREQIDHILATRELGPARGEAMELPMSDHRALYADL